MRLVAGGVKRRDTGVLPERPQAPSRQAHGSESAHKLHAIAIKSQGPVEHDAVTVHAELTLRATDCACAHPPAYS